MARSCALRATLTLGGSLRTRRIIPLIARNGWTGTGVCTIWNQKRRSNLSAAMRCWRLVARGTNQCGIGCVELDAVDDRTEQVVLPKSDLRKALNYVRNHWDELTRYLDDTDLPQDNNLYEQLMRDVAVGRKNWIFAGNLAGGEPNAGFLSLVSSAHRNDLDGWGYVDDVLKRLLAGETDDEPMLPWNWAADHPKSIRTYHEDERRDREIRKRVKRQRRRATQKRQTKLQRRSARRQPPTIGPPPRSPGQWCSETLTSQGYDLPANRAD